MNLEDFFEGIIARGSATKTAVNYVQAVRPLFVYCEINQLDILTLTASEIRTFSETRPDSSSTRNLLRSGLKAYYELAGRFDAPYRAVRVPARARMRCRALDDRDAALLAHVARARGDRKGLVVLLGIYCGLRVGEITSLRWCNVSDDGWITVIGKGRERRIPIHPVVASTLKLIAAAGDVEPSDFVLEGRWGTQSNPATLWGWVSELAREAGLTHVPTHVLRHTALATALDLSRDLRAVQELAGHARPETTAGYTRVKNDRLRQVAFAVTYGGES
jgi:integrase/recombinase XerC